MCTIEPYQTWIPYARLCCVVPNMDAPSDLKDLCHKPQVLAVSSLNLLIMPIFWFLGSKLRT